MAIDKVKSYFKSFDVNFPVFCLTILFGLGSWLTINGVWVELPTIVNFVPEQWKLSSYLSIIGQIANIGPTAVLILNKVRPKWLNETFVTYVIIIVGTASCISSAFLWQKTSAVGGEEHSVALFIFVFLLGLCDCTSTVIFLPFMALLKPDYMTGLYIGEGLSALVPAVIALGQGVGNTECRNVSTVNITINITIFHTEQVSSSPNFPVRDFFLALATMMIICGISFSLLRYAPFCKSERLSLTDNSAKSISTSCQLQEKKDSANGHADTTVLIQKHEHSMSKTTKVVWLAVIIWVSFLANGFLPSISTYSALPYGTDAYHLAAILENIANPLAPTLAFFLPAKSFRSLLSTALAGSIFSVYLIVLAGMSPSPPLAGSLAGSFLMVVCYIGKTCLFIYTKVCVAVLFRLDGKQSLFLLGGVTQLGACLGSVVAYILVNVIVVFQSSPQC
ncbi:solute carrier family 52, riboflavin transporter, member 3-B-like [Saccostrea echinata]|uniref:solute carrier family 52, riboflavin transporter, member 3-B-like n=1 Tax=Saccostrea echinata TaxID=191078 RepID=UPI002A83BEB1|nr:solute carrier family 52, riboflavin transporter, member 3-B-like [Saccostrea echinata]